MARIEILSEKIMDRIFDRAIVITGSIRNVNDIEDVKMSKFLYVLLDRLREYVRWINDNYDKINNNEQAIILVTYGYAMHQAVDTLKIFSNTHSIGEKELFLSSRSEIDKVFGRDTGATNYNIFSYIRCALLAHPFQIKVLQSNKKEHMYEWHYAYSVVILNNHIIIKLGNYIDDLNKKSIALPIEELLDYIKYQYELIDKLTKKLVQQVDEMCSTELSYRLSCVGLKSINNSSRIFNESNLLVEYLTCKTTNAEVIKFQRLIHGYLDEYIDTMQIDTSLYKPAVFISVMVQGLLGVPDRYKEYEYLIDKLRGFNDRDNIDDIMETIYKIREVGICTSEDLDAKDLSVTERKMLVDFSILRMNLDE